MVTWRSAALAALLVSCASLPPQFGESAPPLDGDSVAARGSFLYHDNRDDFFRPDPRDPALVLEARITKRRGDWADFSGARHRTLFSRSGAADWSVEYDAGAVDKYGTSDYLVKPLRLPGGFELSAFSTKGLRAALPLPIPVWKGTWQGRPVRLEATRSFGLILSAAGTGNAWSSLLEPYQRFQLKDQQGNLLAELENLGGEVESRYEYRITAAAGPGAVEGLTAVLAATAALHRFLEAADNYRTGWSPDVRSDPTLRPSLNDWPWE